MKQNKAHKERAHSKFSASGSERWLNCAASVALEEKAPPSKDTFWSVEGTTAHEGHEKLIDYKLGKDKSWLKWKSTFSTKEYFQPGQGQVKANFIHAHMVPHIRKSVDVILKVAEKTQGEVISEQKISMEFIHPEMFGTTDAGVLEHFAHLHVFDYKHGQGHVVSPVKNTQMIQYALGLAHKYNWDFEHVTMHILQPRAGGNFHKTWTISIEELRRHLPLWQRGVDRVESGKSKPFAGNWCHFCRAKNYNCPIKTEKRLNDIKNKFQNSPIK